MRESDMDRVGDLIARVLGSPEDDRALAIVGTEVKQLCRKFPLYPHQQ
jgi:glycine/serine hydroxymethyltransferase